MLLSQAPTWQKGISSHCHCTRTCYEVMSVCVCSFYDQLISPPFTVMCHLTSSWKVCHLVRFPLSASLLPIQTCQASTHCKHTHAQETSRHECSAIMGIWRSTMPCCVNMLVFCNTVGYINGSTSLSDVSMNALKVTLHTLFQMCSQRQLAILNIWDI